MQIGSDEHKELFCTTFIAAHRAYEPAELPWPQLDELSLARLRAIPIWTMALEVERGAGTMLDGYAQTEPDPLVRKAIALQAFEEARHGRILSHMVERYGITVAPKPSEQMPTREAFVHFGYDECVDSFAGFGIFKLACDSRILPAALTSVFARVLAEEAQHIVFFVNWIAWDRYRRGLRGTAAQAFPSLASYGSAIWRRVTGGAEMVGGGGQREGDPIIDLFGDVMEGLTPVKFLRASLEENDRYMRDFDPRLLRPRVIPALGRAALPVLELLERLSELLARIRATLTRQPQG